MQGVQRLGLPACSRAAPRQGTSMQRTLSITTARSRSTLLCVCKEKTTSGRKGDKPQEKAPAKLDMYLKKHPIFSRFADTTLIFGDCVMVLATQLSSERVGMEDAFVYAGIMMACWVAVGGWLGDYKGEPATVDNFQLSLLGPAFPAVMNSTVTWAFAATSSLAVLSALGAQGLINAVPLVQDINTEDTSPQLEIVVALLVVMTCWRGIAARLRW